MHRAAPLRAVALALLAASLVGQTSTDLLVADFYKVRTRELAEAGQRHLELGSWARKAGLVPQATAQFLRAVEVSQGKNPGAEMVLNIMRSYGDAFWRKKREHPPQALLNECEKRSAAIESKTRKAHVELAQRASKAHLDDLSKEHWLQVLKLGGELEVDDKGQWRLDGERVADDLVDWLKERSTKVNGDKVVFEVAGTAAPKLENAIERRSDKLVVRTDLPGAQADMLQALGKALWPLLEDRIDGCPSRPLRLLVFAHRADYEAYLRARQLDQHIAGRGLCDYGAWQTLINADGLAQEDLQAIVLHELSHLFFFGTAPATMPDWYAEGFAESFGAQGSFTWDGKALTVGGLLRKDRLDALKKAPLPLKDLFAGDPTRLLATAPDQAHLYYAQCWALLRFLSEDQCPWNARFEHFEGKCRGQVLGAPEGRLPMGSPEASKKVFQDLFAQDLDKMEQAFKDWLAKL